MTNFKSFGRGAVFALVAASATVGTSTYAVPGYDGLWSVSIVTQKGTCDRRYRYPIRISNGLPAIAGDVAVNIVCKVLPPWAIPSTVRSARHLAHGGQAAGLPSLMAIFARLPADWASAVGGFLGRGIAPPLRASRVPLCYPPRPSTAYRAAEHIAEAARLREL